MGIISKESTSKKPCHVLDLSNLKHKANHKAADFCK